MQREQSIVIWSLETPAQRQARRDRLFRFDGLLALLEEHNWQHGGEALVPESLFRRYTYLGGNHFHQPVSGTALLDEVLAMQSAHMRRPLRLRLSRHDRSARHMPDFSATTTE